MRAQQLVADFVAEVGEKDVLAVPTID